LLGVHGEYIRELASGKIQHLTGVVHRQFVAVPGNRCRMQFDRIVIVPWRPVDMVHLNLSTLQGGFGVADLQDWRLAEQGFQLPRLFLGLLE
jgi:hypothetical protein